MASEFRNLQGSAHASELHMCRMLLQYIYVGVSLLCWVSTSYLTTYHTFDGGICGSLPVWFFQWKRSTKKRVSEKNPGSRFSAYMWSLQALSYMITFGAKIKKTPVLTVRVLKVDSDNSVRWSKSGGHTHGHWGPAWCVYLILAIPMIGT